jgi:hypothetical protein
MTFRLDLTNDQRNDDIKNDQRNNDIKNAFRGKESSVPLDARIIRRERDPIERESKPIEIKTTELKRTRKFTF